jgi:AraC-like DNA-binding protein
VLFDVARPLDEAPPFMASVEAFHFGPLSFAQTRVTPQCFSRSRRKIARDGVDSYLLTLFLDGGYQGAAGTEEVQVRPGDICILDLGQTVSTRHTATNSLALFIPRDELDSALSQSGNLHGAMLPRDNCLGMMLADQLAALRRRLPDLTIADGPQVADALVELVAACFRPTADSLTRARAQVATAALELIKRYIEQRLTTPDLSPESIAANFRMSRATLYRLFEPLGGVAAYIWERRLARAYAALIHPANHRRPIYDIAFDCGFGSEVHFSRAFRRVFGLPPSELRRVALPNRSRSSERNFVGKDRRER